MKKLLPILLLIVSFNCYSQQYATKNYVDSLYSTLDSTVVKMVMVTTTNSTVILDTLTTYTNTRRLYHVTVTTDNDICVKYVYIGNVNGTYTLLADKNTLTLSTKGFFSSIPSISVILSNNQIIIKATGMKNQIVHWQLSKAIEK